MQGSLRRKGALLRHPVHEPRLRRRRPVEREQCNSKPWPHWCGSSYSQSVSSLLSSNDRAPVGGVRTDDLAGRIKVGTPQPLDRGFSHRLVFALAGAAAGVGPGPDRPRTGMLGISRRPLFGSRSPHGCAGPQADQPPSRDRASEAHSSEHAEATGTSPLHCPVPPHSYRAPHLKLRGFP